MNKRQKVVIVIWIAAVAVLGVLWVPWENIEMTAVGNLSTGDLGYAPLFSPPEGDEVGRYPAHARVDLVRVMLELIVATLSAGGLLLLFKRSSDA